MFTPHYILIDRPVKEKIATNKERRANKYTDVFTWRYL
jgi:hypothetical protein